MTAIAFDGKFLVADGLYLQGNYKGYTQKIWKIEVSGFGLVALALSGTTKGSQILRHQIKNNIVKQVDDYDATCIYGLMIDHKGKVYDIYGDGTIGEGRHEIATCGSAWEFLYGAMCAGMSAVNAIELASRYRADVGGSIVKFSVEELR